MGLMDKIEDRSAVVGVIGLGYVGLPLVRSFHGAGLRVLGLDTDPVKIDALRAGRFTPTGDFERLEQADAMFVVTLLIATVRRPMRRWVSRWFVILPAAVTARIMLYVPLPLMLIASLTNRSAPPADDVDLADAVLAHPPSLPKPGPRKRPEPEGND